MGCIEIFLVLLFCLPLPSMIKAPLLRFIASGALDGVAHFLRWVFGLIFILFGDAVRRVIFYKDLKSIHKDEGANYMALKDDRMKLFREERNLYLAGGTLVLNRLYALSSEVEKLKASSEAMKKQAANASNFAQSLLNEQDKDKKKEGIKKDQKDEKKVEPEDETTAEFPDVPDKGAVKEGTGLRQRSKKAD